MNLSTNSLLAFAGLGPSEVILVLCVLILLFGAKKLPELARGIGKSMNEFKKASKEGEAGSEDAADNDVKAQLAATKAELAAAKEADRLKAELAAAKAELAATKAAKRE